MNVINYMKKYIFILLLAFSAVSFSCDCVSIGPFVKTIKSADIIVSGKVISYDFRKRSFYLEVQRVFRGNIKKNKIRVWGDIGNLCRPYVTEFKLNNAYVLNIYTPTSKFDKAGRHKYAISICGVNWLHRDNSTVTGMIFNEKEEVTISIEKLGILIDGS